MVQRWAAVGAMVLLGCGGTPVRAVPADAAGIDVVPGADASPGVDAGGAAVPLDQLFGQLTLAACEALLRCPNGNDSTARLLFGEPTACARVIQRLGSADLDDLQRGVREGRVRYDGVAAARCIASLRARCDVNLSVAELCGDVFQGTVAPNGQCFRHEECAADHYCRSDARTCPGVCTPRRAPGMPCDGAQQCVGSGSAPGVCLIDSAAASVRCVRVTAQANATEGMPCGVVVPPGQSDGARVTCAAGLYCRTVAPAQEGTCQRPLPANAPCRTGDVCEGMNVCAGAMCRPVTLVSAAGVACDPGALRVCNPLENLSCTMGACVSNGTRGEGSACATGDIVETFSCDPGLFCDPTSRRCTRQLAAGMACTSERMCASGECAQQRCLDRQCNTAR
ncbi:MAG: hypothetical protein U0325_06625 [Polyangiales bacterium]